MQKKIIALAIAGLASTAAFAQSNVTIYGSIDAGYGHQSGSSGGVANSVSTNGIGSYHGGSKLGFSGSEDLGNGLKAVFKLETSLYTDRNITGTTDTSKANATAGGMFGYNKQSYVGLTGGFGTVVVGRLVGVRYGNYIAAAQTGAGGYNNMGSMVNQTDRADNAIAYISPSFGGFSVLAAYSMNAGLNGLGSSTEETASGPTNADGRLYTLQGTYANGPLKVTLDGENLKQTNLAVNQLDFTTVNVSGSYDFGVAKVAGLYDHNTLDQGGVEVAKYDVAILSVSAPITAKFTVLGVVGHVNDKTAANQDATKYGLGAQYNLSKRTYLYADYGRVANKDGAHYTIGAADNSNAGVIPGLVASTVTSGAVQGFGLGVVHNF